MKTRWKILLLVAALLLLLTGSLLLTLSMQPANQLEAYKKLLRDRGEKLTLSEVLPPPVPDESNCVEAVQAAFALLGSGPGHVPYAMLGVAPGRAMVGWQQPVAHNYVLTSRFVDWTNSWDEVAVEFAQDDPALEQLRTVFEKPQLDFHLDYKREDYPLRKLQGALIISGRKLSAVTMNSLHAQNAADAATNILTLLKLVRADETDFLLAAHLQRITMLDIAVAPTWELLQTTNVTDAQLAALQQGWEQMDLFHDAETAFAFERARLSFRVQTTREAPSGTTFSSHSSGSPAMASGIVAWTAGLRNGAGEMMWRSSWSFPIELTALQRGQIVLETLRAMQTNQLGGCKSNFDGMKKRLAQVRDDFRGAAFFGALKIPDLRRNYYDNFYESPVAQTIRMEAARRVVITAIALKRFELKRGNARENLARMVPDLLSTVPTEAQAGEALPKNLSELVPEFLSAVPVDAYDGKPLRYHPNGDGTYLLYCIGADGVDDGGDARIPGTSSPAYYYWLDMHVRDWVWPQPATEAEIKLFYEHPPK